MKKVAIVVGTRPELIKMAPIVKAIRSGSSMNLSIISTGQHKELSDGVAKDFGIFPDINLNIMDRARGLVNAASIAMAGLEEIFERSKPDMVLAQGDTISVLAAAQVSFFNKIPFGHVEAGLRSFDLDQPFPEEYIRRCATIAAKWNFCATPENAATLKHEGVRDESIYVTGNTVIDALYWILENIPNCPRQFLTGNAKLLVTIHRRENQNDNLLSICRAVRSIAEGNPIEVLWPVHLNPAVRGIIHREMAGTPSVRCVEPLSYRAFVQAMSEADIILSDSGGVQEEAPALGVPVLVAREVTERPEAVSSGVNRLVGADTDSILAGFYEWFNNNSVRDHVKLTRSPYGDGLAAKRIIRALSSIS